MSWMLYYFEIRNESVAEIDDTAVPYPFRKFVSVKGVPFASTGSDPKRSLPTIKWMWKLSHNPIFTNAFEGYSDFIARTISFAPEVEEKAEEIRKLLLSQGPFLALHMRRGDRTKNKRLVVSAEKYILRAQEAGAPLQNIFVLTDDYAGVLEIQKATGKMPFSLCTPDMHGHLQKTFNSDPTNECKTLTLLTEIAVAKEAAFFVGYAYSAVSWEIVHRRGEKKFVLLQEGNEFVSEERIRKGGAFVAIASGPSLFKGRN